MNNKDSISKLQNIIKSLRLQNFSYLEEDVSEELKNLIKNLPEPESLFWLIKNGKQKEIEKKISNIINIINHYSINDENYKNRYFSKKGLFPRYKSLHYINNTKKIAKTLLLVSEIADNNNCDYIAKMSLNLATRKNFSKEEINKLICNLYKNKMYKEISILEKRMKS